jgi:uncharacterized membrane protein YdbT with pleckstrin-like domain
MSYVQRILEPGEKVLLDGHLHWLVFVPSALLMLLGIAGGLACAAFPLGWPLLWILPAAIFLFGAFHYLVRRATEVVVTDRRVILKTGFLTRHTLEINNAKIESVDVNQSLLGRMLDYGDVSVRGTGSAITTFDMVDDPLAFRRAILSMSS